MKSQSRPRTNNKAEQSFLENRRLNKMHTSGFGCCLYSVLVSCGNQVSLSAGLWTSDPENVRYSLMWSTEAQGGRTRGHRSKPLIQPISRSWELLEMLLLTHPSWWQESPGTTSCTEWPWILSRPWPREKSSWNQPCVMEHQYWVDKIQGTIFKSETRRILDFSPQQSFSCFWEYPTYCQIPILCCWSIDSLSRWLSPANHSHILPITTSISCKS